MTKIDADLQKQLKRADHLKGSGRDWAFYKKQERLRQERELAHAGFDLKKLEKLNDKIDAEKEKKRPGYF